MDQAAVNDLQAIFSTGLTAAEPHLALAGSESLSDIARTTFKAFQTAATGLAKGIIPVMPGSDPHGATVQSDLATAMSNVYGYTNRPEHCISESADGTPIPTFATMNPESMMVFRNLQPIADKLLTLDLRICN
jgi:hypothetical protein